MESQKITKNNLVDSIYKSTNLEKQVIQEVVDNLLFQLKESLENGATIELRGFGTFEPRLRKRESARNPKTGEILSLEPHYVAAFRPGQELKEKLWNLKINDEN